MKIWYLGFTGIQEETSTFSQCYRCLFDFLESDCCKYPLFDNLHPCCSNQKYYKEIAKSDIFNL